MSDLCLSGDCSECGDQSCRCDCHRPARLPGRVVAVLAPVAALVVACSTGASAPTNVGAAPSTSNEPATSLDETTTTVEVVVPAEQATTVVAELPGTLPPASVARSTLPVDLGGVWWRLALCESGGDPTTNTGNGYYGAFQFALSTWLSVGETGYPHEFSYAHQLAAAQRLQARSGFGQWPGCARALGLL